MKEERAAAIFEALIDNDQYTPERHLPTPGQRGYSPQLHTAAGTAARTTMDTENTVPQRGNPAQTAYAHSRNRAQAQSQRLGTWYQYYIYVYLSLI